MKIALVYDRVNKWGGAERVLLALHKLFPNAPLFTSVYHPKQAPWADQFAVKPSFLQKYPHIVRNHELYPFLMPLAFEQFSFDDYDLVISVTSESAKGIVTGPKTKHLCYCLTPTRYLWSGYDQYFSSMPLRVAASPVVSYLRKWDAMAASRPDVFVAISDEVKKRIKTYYGREAAIIYPPVALIQQQPKLKKGTKPYFLIVSRLSKFTKYKRIDLAIQACNELKLPLKIIGEGSWKKELQQMAGPTIEFIGTVNDEELKSYYVNATALLFPAHEDFGLTVVEAQGFGKPVIAYRGGGALETIKEGITGLFFDAQTKDALKSTLTAFKQMSFNEERIRKHAQQFGEEQFAKKFLKLVKNIR